MNFQINRCIFLSQFLSQKLKSNPLNFLLAIFFSLPKLRTLLDNIWKTIKAIITTTTRLFTYLAISTFLESKSVQIAGRMRTESTLFPTPSPDIKSSLATGVTYAVYTGEAAGGGGGRATREGMPRQENQCHVESGYIHTYIHVACKGNRFADGLSLDGAFVRAGKVFSLQSDALRATVTRGSSEGRKRRRKEEVSSRYTPPSLPSSPRFLISFSSSLESFPVGVRQPAIPFPPILPAPWFSNEFAIHRARSRGIGRIWIIRFPRL